MVGAAFGLGFIFGPGDRRRADPLGPVGADVVSPSALCFGNFVAACFLLPESRHGESGASRRSDGWTCSAGATRDRRLLLLLALYFIVTMAFSGFEATFALFSERRSASPPRPSAISSRSSASCWRS